MYEPLSPEDVSPEELRHALRKVPAPPREPSPRAKRLVHGYAGAQLVMLLVGAIFTAVGLPLSLVFGWGLPGDAYLDFRGEPATARVLHAELDRNVEINEQHPTRISFEYQVDGRTYSAESTTLDEALVAAAQPDAELPIEVVMASPEYARLRGATYSTFGYFVSFVFLFPVIGLSLLVFTVRANRREIRAFREGTPAWAKVTFAGPDTSTRMNGQNPWKVAWELTVDGKCYQGSLSSMNRAALGELLEARQLVVLYLPENPAINTAWVE